MVYYYLAAEYFSHKRNKMITIFSGPHAPAECDSIFNSSIRPYPNSSYEVYQSFHANRDRARGEWIAKKLGGGMPIDDAMGRTMKQAPDKEQERENYLGS
jgi:hypothetical protein